MAEYTIAGIQGGILLGAAPKNEGVFMRALFRLRARLEAVVVEIRPLSH
jgi:hypothetical protein